MIVRATVARATRIPYASLPWYDLPEMHAINDAFWSALRATLRANGEDDVPDDLDREREYGTDREGAAYLTQTCGLPLVTTAREHFDVVGALAYRVPGCLGSHHRSFIVVRAAGDIRSLEALRGTRFAINERDSNSGMNLPRRLFAPLARAGRFFGTTIVTGSHAASARAVACGDAGAAAIDCVTYAFLGRYRPHEIAPLRTIAETASTPTPPLVTTRHAPPGRVGALRRALADVIANDAYAALRDALFLHDVEACDASAYTLVSRYEREATALGYATLA